MCFSPEASFASGAVMGVIGVFTLTKVRSWGDLLLGMIPLLFAGHQVEEGIVWLWMDGRVGPRAGGWAVWLYILYAHALLIAIAPWSIWLAEPNRKRRRLMTPFLVLGTGLCGFALWQLSTGPIHAQVRHNGIEYRDAVTGFWWFAALYVTATCGAPFFSSYPWMVTFGVLNLVALVVVGAFKAMYLTSLWCAVAALLSVLIYLHFRRVRRPTAAPAVE